LTLTGAKDTVSVGGLTAKGVDVLLIIDQSPTFSPDVSLLVYVTVLVINFPSLSMGSWVLGHSLCLAASSIILLAKDSLVSTEAHLDE
jgi:hypothetical protein